MLYAEPTVHMLLRGVDVDDNVLKLKDRILHPVEVFALRGCLRGLSVDVQCRSVRLEM